MNGGLTDRELLYELEGVAEQEVDRHLATAKEWHPHDYVPWDDGRNFEMLGGVDWDPEQSQLSDTAKAAMVTNLLTEDNLPSYHREIAEHFSRDGAWGTWVGRWTAEEAKHSIVMRDYLVVTRGVDPVALENARMAHMTQGFDPGPSSMLDSVSYVTFQELATRVSHRNTGKACGDPIADRMLARVAADENLHMMFYRNIVQAALDVAPDQAIASIHKVLTNFQMPGAGMDNFRRNAVLIAKGGIYDLRQHIEDVVNPVLRKWKLFERNDFGPTGEKYREEIATFLDDLGVKAKKFEESRDRALAREARRAERASS
ncbi:acyl-ACP desaturase [Rhodococcus triatomae]|uniref:Acyl-[acyl-carrier-protein] desaturase n=1 Tax=Rhodococcus triatomae TaxID=300028 RepID=A0A1G8AIL3_9NOCA|nr:acyl-ACP desaturase [Rhodococcus triatomae]QNG17756.1 acyl-ACP desaturase [Rhodococcus triatomae]QNG22576.1 acyl-ACP desaturase [Rhodococcus triatomae]SDH20761.1 acyl-[acyl-carrier-protein] desaturase [Rhodococcus triatomae]